MLLVAMNTGPHLIFRTPIKVSTAEIFSSSNSETLPYIHTEQAQLLSEKVFIMYKWKKAKVCCS